MRRIDTHQHLLYPDRFSYAWTDDLPTLARRPFTLDDYRSATAGCDIAGTLFMEVDVPEKDTAAEAAFFCRLAENPQNNLLGVIASCRPEHENFDRYIDQVRHPRLRGFRRILHTQPDTLSESSLFRRHVASLATHDLTFDVCVLARQLPQAIALADACPDTRLILDHCGVPEVASGNLDPWREHIRELARRPHVACKLSGLIAYTAPDRCTPNALRPYLEHVIACFGWDRVVWGGDWPVCNLTASLKQWVHFLDEILAAESPANLARLYHDNARRIYRV